MQFLQFRRCPHFDLRNSFGARTVSLMVTLNEQALSTSLGRRATSWINQLFYRRAIVTSGQDRPRLSFYTEHRMSTWHQFYWQLQKLRSKRGHRSFSLQVDIFDETEVGTNSLLLLLTFFQQRALASKIDVRQYFLGDTSHSLDKSVHSTKQKYGNFF